MNVFFRILSTLAVVSLVGCATVSETPGGTGDSTGGLSKTSISPEPPATLKVGEKVMVSTTYKLPAGQSAKFSVRPYKEGSRARSYMAHPIVVCEPGRGKAEGWFTFQKPETIDEIRIYMTDTASSDVLSESILPAALTWE